MGENIWSNIILDLIFNRLQTVKSPILHNVVGLAKSTEGLRTKDSSSHK